MAAREENQNAVKHNGYGLSKRVYTDLTTKNDYSRFVEKLNEWGLSVEDIKKLGMVGSAIQTKAWQVLISEDALGAYLWSKENKSDDLELIIRLGRNAQYQLSKAGKDLISFHQVLQDDTNILEAAIASTKGDDDEHNDAD